MRNLVKPRLERIGVGFDARPGSRSTLALAGSIANAAGAELVVCGVVDDRVPGGLAVEQTVLEGGTVVTGQLVRLLDRELAAARAAPGREAEHYESAERVAIHSRDSGAGCSVGR